MSGKINVWAIVSAHFGTIRHHGQNRLSIVDLTVFFICPLSIACLVFYARLPFVPSLVSALINASAILLGLLLNLLVLMFDLRSKASDDMDKLNGQKPLDKKRLARLSLRCEVIDESVANISFTVLLCIGSLVSLLLFSMREDTVGVDAIESTAYAWNAFIWINVSLTIMMIIKRVFVLFEASK